MNLKARSAAAAALPRYLLATLVLGFVSCDGHEDKGKSSPMSISNREPRKYLELDDLNAFESPATRLAASHADGSEEVLVEYLAKSAGRPKKVIRRQAPVQKNSVAQSPKKQKPGFLWTIARVTYETFNDTRSAIKQIGQIINESIPPDQPKKKKPASASLKKPIGGAKAASTSNKKPSDATVAATTQPTTTTTEEFKLTRPLLQSLVRRNVLGLVRLFNIEWRDAISESKNTVREFRSDLGKQIGMYLQDNLNNY